MYFPPNAVNEESSYDLNEGKSSSESSSDTTDVDQVCLPQTTALHGLNPSTIHYNVAGGRHRGVGEPWLPCVLQLCIRASTESPSIPCGKSV